MEKGMGAKRQDPARIRKRNAGFAAFFISGICAISCGSGREKRKNRKTHKNHKEE